MIDIITINLNNKSGLYETADSLKYIKHASSVDKKILIDGNSSDLNDRDFQTLSETYDIIVSERDNGIYDAMNKGLKLASSKHVLMLNSGDTLLPKAQSTLNTQKEMSQNTIYAFEWTSKGYYYSTKSKLYLYLGNFCYCHQSLLIPRKIYYSCQYEISGDHELLLRALKIGYTIKHIHSPLANYADGGISSKRKIRKLIEKLKISILYVPLYMIPITITYNLLTGLGTQRILKFLEPLERRRINA